jgi:phosphatidylinositol-3-phosphatase
MKTKVSFALFGLLMITVLSYAQSASTATAVHHVVIVVEENHSYEQVIGNKSMPFLNHLAAQYSLATNFYADAHNSIPNYFWLTAGQHITYSDNTTNNFDVDNIVRHLLLSGLTWKSYAESIPSAGYVGYNTGQYVKRHNPVSYFPDVRNSSSERMNIVPITRVASDSKAGHLPNLAFIVPNLVHDGHNGNLGLLDSWLASTLKPVLASAAFQPGGDGLLIVAFDESYHADCRPAGSCTHGTAPFGGRVAAIFAGPRARTANRSSKRYYHENVLSTVCHVLAIAGCPGKGASAASMSDMLK